MILPYLNRSIKYSKSVQEFGTMTDNRGASEAPSDSRVEIVKVKLRTRNRKVPVMPVQIEDKLDPVSSELFPAASTPSQLKTPDSESPDQFKYESDFNGNLLKEVSAGGTNLKRNRPVSSASDSDSVAFLRGPRMTSSTSNLALVKPLNIPVERFPLEENIIDIAVAEVINPSKLFVNMGKSKTISFDHLTEFSLITASSYDQLNQMMDEIDHFYENLLREEGLSKQSSKQSSKWEKMRGSITVGEYVAVTWLDQMWYRAKVKNFVNHAELRVFYIDYGTTRVVRLEVHGGR